LTSISNWAGIPGIAGVAVTIAADGVVVASMVVVVGLAAIVVTIVLVACVMGSARGLLALLLL